MWTSLIQDAHTVIQRLPNATKPLYFLWLEIKNWMP